MPNLIEIQCEICGDTVKRLQGEVNRSRRLGRRLFCSRSCSAEASNIPRRSKEFVTTCPFCGDDFVTSTLNRAKTFCSRSCASKGSLTEKSMKARRESGFKSRKNLLSAVECLRLREGWKYAALREHLGDRLYQFEFEIKECVFDLALLDVQVLVEFDGKYHGSAKQRVRDADKDKVAAEAGFKVVRRRVEQSTVISPATIAGL